MITVKVDMDKVDPKRFFKGAKGTYLDLVLIETPNGQYGDFMVKQSVTKEERLARVQMPFLGNAKIMGGAPKPPPPSTPKPGLDENPDF